MTNLFSNNVKRDFYVWIDMTNPIISNNFNVGSFVSVPIYPKTDNLMFVSNPNSKGFISLFQANLMWKYMTEYNFELTRRTFFKNYPSRLEAIYLLPSRQEAMKYKKKHQAHVKNRVLKKVFTVGDYIYSIHDTSWIDFCHILASLDKQTWNYVSKDYWKGISVEDRKLQSHGKLWTTTPIMEFLYIGRVNFYNKKLTDDL